jgi:hypothetical protein
LHLRRPGCGVAGALFSKRAVVSSGEGARAARRPFLPPFQLATAVRPAPCESKPARAPVAACAAPRASGAAPRLSARSPRVRHAAPFIIKPDRWRPPSPPLRERGGVGGSGQRPRDFPPHPLAASPHPESAPILPPILPRYLLPSRESSPSIINTIGRIGDDHRHYDLRPRPAPGWGGED